MSESAWVVVSINRAMSHFEACRDSPPTIPSFEFVLPKTPRERTRVEPHCPRCERVAPRWRPDSKGHFRSKSKTQRRGSRGRSFRPSCIQDGPLCAPQLAGSDEGEGEQLQAAADFGHPLPP